MKIRQEDNLILTNGNNEKKFTIQASAKAFQILSSALYSRKVEAIIRELSCNAVDSHMMAGWPERPFTVHLPNEWSPEFYVEDYGIGLSAEDVENIYTSYFTSTKTESNDVIGGLGLGSKTPFSYTDSFNIRTRKDGIECHYNAYINMAGEPSVSLLSSTVTGENNGVRVTVPVKADDFGQFRNDATVVYKWFPVMPEIIGQDLLVDNAHALRLIKEGSFWAEYGKGSYNKNIIYAVMGNVSYHVPNVAETFQDHFTPGELNFFRNNSLYVKFDIGDLDVAASRETISFDDDTEKVFVDKVRDVIRLFSQETQDRLDIEITNYVDAIRLVQDSVGLWAHDMFSYKGVTIQKLAAQSFTALIRKTGELVSADGGAAVSLFEDFYFGRNNRGQVKRHSLDYTAYHTFTRLAGKGIVVLMGSEKGYQRIARNIAADHTLFGVFFTNTVLSTELKEDLIGYFGSQIKFVVAADEIEHDRLDRKAIRDAQRAAAGPVVRTATANRISKEELRCRFFAMSNDMTSSTFGERVIDGETLKDKRYAVLFDWYNEGELVTALVDANGTAISVSVNTSLESRMYAICRSLKVDCLIIVKNETFKKAVRLFGEGAVTIDSIDEDFLAELAIVGGLRFWGDRVTVESLIQAENTSHTYGPTFELLVRQVERFIQDNPDCELAKVVELDDKREHYATYSDVPECIRAMIPVDKYKPQLASIKGDITRISEEVEARYPMLFDATDVQSIEEYIKLVDSIKSAKEVDVVVVEEE